MAQFNGIMPDGIDLSQFEGIPEYLINKQSRLSDFNPERDSKLNVKFFQDSYFQIGKTQEMGVPIFSTEVFIQIVLPDNRTKFIQRVKMDEKGKPHPSYAKWTTRFPREWEAFQKGIVQGYPLKQLPHVDKGLIATLEMVGVKTAEALLELKGEIFERLPALEELQNQARKFLENKDVIEMHAEKSKVLEAQVKELQSKLKDANSSSNSNKRSPKAEAQPA